MAITISVNRATNISESETIVRSVDTPETISINRQFNPSESDAILIGDILLIGFKPTGFIIY